MLKLRQYRDRVRSEGAPMPDFSHLVREQQDDGERRLLMHSPEIIALLEQTPAFDREPIQPHAGYHAVRSWASNGSATAAN